MKYKVAKSKIHGDGIFATQPIAKGEYISDTPDYIDDVNQTIASSFHNHDEKNANVLNVKRGNKRFLIAKRGIEVGEELTADYNLTPSPPFEDPNDFKDLDERELSLSNPEELQALINAGYELEELHEGGEPGHTHDPLPAEYLKSEGFVKATNQDLDSLLRGFNTDGYDSHWYEGSAENYGVTSDQLRAFAGDYHPKSFVNAAAYSQAMNKLANDAGGKNVINIPFADNPIVMRTADDDVEYVEYEKPTTLQEEGYIDETGTNAVNQYQSRGLAKRYTQFKNGGTNPQYIKNVISLLEKPGVHPLDLVYGNENFGIPKMGTLAGLKSIPELADYFFDPNGDMMDTYMELRGNSEVAAEAAKRKRENYLSNVGRTEEEDIAFEEKRMAELEEQTQKDIKEKEDARLKLGRDRLGNVVSPWEYSFLEPNAYAYYKNMKDAGFGDILKVATDPLGEESIDAFLGDPMIKAKYLATEAGKETGDPLDNYRHATAGRLVAERISDVTGSPLLGYVGSNIFGVGHELGTIFEDSRPWLVKGTEALEDIYNNNVGAETILNNIPQEEDNKIILDKAIWGAIPDGYGAKHPFKDNPTWVDPYSFPKDKDGFPIIPEKRQLGGPPPPDNLTYAQKKQAYDDSLTLYNFSRDLLDLHKELEEFPPQGNMTEGEYDRYLAKTAPQKLARFDQASFPYGNVSDAILRLKALNKDYPGYYGNTLDIPSGSDQYLSKRFTTYQKPILPIRKPTMKEAYENVDKEKYPTFEDFEYAAEFYKEHGENPDPSDLPSNRLPAPPPPNYEIEDIEPEVEIEKLDVIKPELISNDAEIPELVDREEEEIDYKRKFGVWLEDKADKKARLKTFFKYAAPEFFNPKKSRVSQYYRTPKRLRAGFYNEPIEDEQIYPEGFVPMFQGGEFIEIDLTPDQVKMYKNGGYVLEEMDERGEDDKQKKKKKKKKENPCAPGLMPGPKDANGQNTCIEDPNYIRPIKRNEAETTVYGTDQGKAKQRNLIQKLDQAKRAMKSFYKDRGLKGLFLKQDPTQEIGVLEQNIEGYKDFLEEEKKRYAMADKALLNLQKYYPQTWNDRNVSDVLSGTGYQSLSNLFKSGKISQPTFMSFYKNFANEFDPNMVKGYGPNAGYDGRKLREVWGDDWDDFVELIGNFAMGAPIAGGAGALGPSIAPILESLAPVASATGSAMTAPLFSGAPSWLTPGLVAEFAGAVYSADQIIDKNSATRQSINKAIENPTADNIAGATAETIMTGLGLGPTAKATFKGAKPLLDEFMAASQVPTRAQSFGSGTGSLVDDVRSGVSDIKNAVKGSTKAEVKALPSGNTTYIPEESLPFKQDELNPEFQNKNITGIFGDKAKAAKNSDLPTQRISENYLKDNNGFVRIKPDRLENVKQQQDEIAQFALDFNTVWTEGNLSNKTKRVTKDLQKLLKEQEELNRTGGAAYQKLRQVKSAANKDVYNYETNVFAQLKGGYSPSHSVTEAEKMIKQLKSEMEAVKSVKRKGHYKDAISKIEKHVVEFKKDMLKPPVKSQVGDLNLVPEDSWFIEDNSKSFRALRQDIIKARSDENLVKSASNYNDRIIPLSSQIDEAVDEINILDILEPDVRKRIETLRQTYDAPLSSENVISTLETRGTLGQTNKQGYKTSSVVEGRAGDPSLEGTHLKDASQQKLDSIRGEAIGKTSAATKRSDPMKIRVEDAVSEYRGKIRGTDDELERIYEVWSKGENPVLEGYVNYTRNIYKNPLEMAGTVGHEDRHIFHNITGYLDPYVEWAEKFGYYVSKLDTKTGKYLSQVMEDPVKITASGKKSFQTWLSSPKEVDANLVKERVTFAWDKYTKARQAKPNASREELIQDIVKDMKLPENRKKFIEDLMTSPQGNEVQQHFKKKFRGSIDPANDTQAIMSRKQFIRDFLQTMPVIIIALGLQSSITSNDSSSGKTKRKNKNFKGDKIKRLGGSVEVNLSPEDVQRYIDEGYILEEID